MSGRGQSDENPARKFVWTLCLFCVLGLPHHLPYEIHRLIQEWHTAEVVIWSLFRNIMQATASLGPKDI